MSFTSYSLSTMANVLSEYLKLHNEYSAKYGSTVTSINVINRMSYCKLNRKQGQHDIQCIDAQNYDLACM